MVASPLIGVIWMLLFDDDGDENNGNDAKTGKELQLAELLILRKLKKMREKMNSDVLRTA